MIGAKDASEAIEILRTDRHVGFMMSDIMMPGGINGHELAEHAKKLLPELAVLSMPGYSQDALRQGRSFPLISKPFGLEPHCESVQDAISGKVFSAK